LLVFLTSVEIFEVRGKDVYLLATESCVENCVRLKKRVEFHKTLQKRRTKNYKVAILDLGKKCWAKPCVKVASIGHQRNETVESGTWMDFYFLIKKVKFNNNLYTKKNFENT